MADETIPSLPSVAVPNTSDLVPIEHGASGGPYTSSRTSIADILALGGGGGGGGSTPTFPFTVLQETAAAVNSASNTLAVNFPKAAASSGATLLLVVSYDARSSTITVPGWTNLITFTQANYAAVAVFSKASAGDTSATITTTGTATSMAAYAVELSGARTLDAYSTLGNASPSLLIPAPALTPTAGSAVFFAVSYIAGTSSLSTLAGKLQGWKDFSVYGDAPSGRPLALAIYNAPAPGTAMPPPAFLVSNPYLSSAATAAVMFSIK